MSKELELKMQDIDSACIMMNYISNILNSKHSAYEKNMLSAMAIFEYSQRELNALRKWSILRKETI